jgi:hypothetical protein
MNPSRERDIARTRLIFLRTRKLTRGFSNMEIINAKARGTRMLRSINTMYTKRITPNRVTVDLKKNGYFFSINRSCV